ncbi:MAG: CoA transferase [Dehalococcoidia bacterium]
MGKKALAGVKVLECAQLVAGPYCGKLLADLGAEVIKIEDPNGGDAARYRGPFPDDIPHPDRSALFLYLNTNKLGITLDLHSPGGVDTFKSLIEDADILIEDMSPKTMGELGLRFETLQKINPKLVMTSITPFGQTGPYAEYKAYPLNTVHSAILGYVTPCGSPYPSREPLKLGGFVTEYACGLSAAVGTFGALFSQKATGSGQHVDVSKQEAILDLARVYAAQYPNLGLNANRMQHLGGTSMLVRCRNGYVVLSLHELHHWRALIKIMGNPEWAQNKLYDNLIERSARFDKEILPRVTRWAENQTKEDLFHKGQAAGSPVTAVMSAEDVAHSEQYKARHFFIDIPHAKENGIKYPGAPCIFSRTPWSIENPAPSLGEHNDLIGRRLSDRKHLHSVIGRTIRKNEPAKLPLEGVRIADFSWAWAGPHAAGLLARLGAQVIKIETNLRVDHSRVLSFTTGSVFQGIDSSPVFSDLNLNKLGITLNLGDPRGTELAKLIVSKSDVVVQNMRPGVMDKLGLGYDALRAVKPDVIMFSLSALGATGPQRQYIGYAPAFGALSGLSHITGYPDDRPALLLGEVDLLSGTTGAYAILAALIHKQRTGEGQHIDLSSAEAISVLIGDVLMDYSMNGRVQSRQGNNDETMAPHNCFRCRGEDKWISIAIATEDEWAAFCRVTGHPEWTSDPRFSDAKSRRQNKAELEKMIGTWTVEHTHYEAMTLLQKAGIAAIPSFNSQELYNDPHLRERNCWVEVAHPLIGKHTVVAPPWKLSGTPARIIRHGPLMGEHNQYVFGELLGLSKPEIENLAAEKVIY